MPKKAEMDLATAHRYFAAHCFNQAWELMEKKGRSPEEDRLMPLLNQASIYHWLQREDCDNHRLSVGYWQAARIQALLGNAAEARRLGQICLDYSQGLAPFYQGYACEALARAEILAGNRAAAEDYAVKARELADQVEEKNDRELLLNDLAGF